MISTGRDKTHLTDLIQLLVQQVKPGLILSIGTAGGAQTGDHVGTVRAVSAGTLYEQNIAPASWPVYQNSWTAIDTVLDTPGFTSLLLPIPTTATDLQSLCTQFNQYYSTSFSLSESTSTASIVATHCRASAIRPAQQPHY